MQDKIVVFLNPQWDEVSEKSFEDVCASIGEMSNFAEPFAMVANEGKKCV